jgi:hypothetical protein
MNLEEQNLAPDLTSTSPEPATTFPPPGQADRNVGVFWGFTAMGCWDKNG